jgi:hypothetical protein
VQNIVLITRENSEKITHAAVFLCNRYDEAALFCGFINKLSLADGERFHARCVLLGNEYVLEKRKQPVFEDILHFDDRKIQRIMREVDASVLAKALSNSDAEVQDKIFRNMSRRAAVMLKEDIEFMGPVDKEDSDIAKSAITSVYDAVDAMGNDEKIKNAFAAFSCKKTDVKEKADENSGGVFWSNDDKDKTYIVMVIRGINDIAECISVMLFDTEENANNCREFINNLKTTDDFFVYARRAEQMVEYETEKPLLVSFDRIFDYDDTVLGIALAKTGTRTVINAMKGLDARSKEKLIITMPEWMEKKVLSELEMMKEVSKKYKHSFSSTLETKLARQKIVDTMNAIDRKIKKGRGSDFGLAKIVAG